MCYIKQRMGFDNRATIVFGWELSEEEAQRIAEAYGVVSCHAFWEVKLPPPLYAIRCSGSPDYEGYTRYGLSLLDRVEEASLEDVQAAMTNDNALEKARELLQRFAPESAEKPPKLFAWPEME